MTIEEAIKIMQDAFAEADVRRSQDEQGHRYGEIADAYKMALDALRAQQERENPKPLTLDELRQMDGEPVWCVDGGGNEMWGLVNAEHAIPDVIDYESGLWRGEFYNMGGGEKKGLYRFGWIAYRNKPSEASDWAGRWLACGMFNRDYTGRPVIELVRPVRREPKPPEGPLDGQMSMIEV